MRKVLVCAGGGCKGYAQVQVLKKLEIDNGILSKYYDLVVGSSVGAINAAMIASGKITMTKLESIYPDMTKKIFKSSWWPFHVPKYDRKNFIEVWNNEIGMIKMKECKTRLQVTSVSLCDKSNHFFKSWEDTEDYVLSDVLKSFAAPFFFGTLVDEENKQVFFDGGMGVANHPVAYGVVEAFLLWPNEQWEFEIVGCGFSNVNDSFDKAKKYKTIKQISEFLELNEGGLARLQSRQEQIGALQVMAKSSNKISMKYYDIEIPKEIDKLDGIKYLDQYKKYGEDMAKKPLIEI